MREKAPAGKEAAVPRRGPSRRLNNRGEGNAGCVVLLLLALVGGYVGYNLMLPWLHHSNFESRMSEMMPYYRNHDADYVQRGIIDIGKEFNLDLKSDQVKVQVLKKDNRLIIDVEYQQVVELPFYTHTWTFKPHLTGSVY